MEEGLPFTVKRVFPLSLSTAIALVLLRIIVSALWEDSLVAQLILSALDLVGWALLGAHSARSLRYSLSSNDEVRGVGWVAGGISGVLWGILVAVLYLFGVDIVLGWGFIWGESSLSVMAGLFGSLIVADTISKEEEW